MESPTAPAAKPTQTQESSKVALISHAPIDSTCAVPLWLHLPLFPLPSLLSTSAATTTTTNFPYYSYYYYSF
jgi:hypothetical protein